MLNARYFFQFIYLKASYINLSRSERARSKLNAIERYLAYPHRIFTLIVSCVQHKMIKKQRDKQQKQGKKRTTT